MAKGYLQDVSWVDFYGKPIITVYSDELGYVVPMKHIIEDHIGLDWTAMRKKINRTSQVYSDVPDEVVEVQLFNPVKVSGYDLSEALDSLNDFPDEDVPEFLHNQEYLCLPVDEINLFLAQININNVSMDVRETLYQYQKECGAALHDYWFRGFSVNSRTNPSRLSSDKHSWCPREMSSKSLLKGADRYAAYAKRQHDSRLNPEEIYMFCTTAISQLLDIENGTWDSHEGALVFNMAFLERAAFDILYACIESNVAPEDLPDILERNLNNAWEHMGTLVISIQSPYTPFEGVGRGMKRELQR